MGRQKKAMVETTLVILALMNLVASFMHLIIIMLLGIVMLVGIIFAMGNIMHMELLSRVREAQCRCAL